MEENLIMKLNLSECRFKCNARELNYVRRFILLLLLFCRDLILRPLQSTWMISERRLPCSLCRRSRSKMSSFIVMSYDVSTIGDEA